MAVDEALLAAVSSGDSPSVLRFYQWHPAAVSIGYNQRAQRDLDLDACQRAGIDVVRRISGGRAVLHWEELTYSISFAEDEPLLGRSVAEAHCAIAHALAAGLREFGVDARVDAKGSAVVTRRPVRRPVIGGGVKEPCFSSTSRFELTCGGRKIVGSAQRRVRGGVIQHGSILIGPGHRLLPQLLLTEAAEQRHLMREQLTAGSTHLSEWCDEVVDVGSLMHCLEVGIRDTLNIEFTRSELSRPERDHADAIVAAAEVTCGG
jgi:lipoate-protein ligase A